MPPPPHPRQCLDLTSGYPPSTHILDRGNSTPRPYWSFHPTITNCQPDIFSRPLTTDAALSSPVPAEGPRDQFQSSSADHEALGRPSTGPTYNANSRREIVNDTYYLPDHHRVPRPKSDFSGVHPADGHTQSNTHYLRSDQHGRNVSSPLNVRSGFNAGIEIRPNRQKPDSLLSASGGELQPAIVSYRTPPRSQGTQVKCLPHLSAHGYGFSSHTRIRSASNDLTHRLPNLPQPYSSRTNTTPTTSPHFRTSLMGSNHGYPAHHVPVRRTNSLFLDQMNRIS